MSYRNNLNKVNKKQKLFERPSNFNSIVSRPGSYFKTYKKLFPNSQLFKLNTSIKPTSNNMDYNPSKPYYASAISFTVDKCVPQYSTTSSSVNDLGVTIKERHQYKLCPLCDPFQKLPGEASTLTIRDNHSLIFLHPREPIFYDCNSNDYDNHMLYRHGVTKHTEYEETLIFDDNVPELIEDCEEESDLEEERMMKELDDELEQIRSSKIDRIHEEEEFEYDSDVSEEL